MSRESDTRLFVGRLSRDVRQRDLEDLFSRYGTIKNCSLKSTYGFVVCLSFGEETDAFSSLFYTGHLEHVALRPYQFNVLASFPLPLSFQWYFA